MIRGIKRTKIFIIVSLLAFLSSCSSLSIKPPGPEAQTILILPFTAKNTSGSPYGYYYQYEIVREGDENFTHEASFKLPNADKFIVIDTLSPGTYIVNKVTTHTVGSGRRDYDDAPDARLDRIKLAYGKISIYGKSINITQKPSGSQGRWVSNYRISSVSREQQAELLEKLQKLANFDRWEVLDSLLTVEQGPAQVPDAGEIVASFPILSVGDTWVASHYHQDHDEATYTYQVTSVDPDGSFEMKIENDKSKNEYYDHFDSRAPWVPMFMGLRFDRQALQFPLFVGKTWETEVEARSVDGDFQTYKNQYVVEEYAIVETAVGNFDAFRIKSNVKNLDTGWSGPSNYWYAPAARTIIKSTHMHVRGIKLLSMDLIE